MKRFCLGLFALALCLSAQVATVPNVDFPTFRTNLNTSLQNAASISGGYTNPSWILSMAFAKLSGVPAFARTDQGNTWTTGVQDFSAATHMRVPNAAGYAPTSNGHFGYDTTSNRFKGYSGAAVGTFFDSLTKADALQAAESCVDAGSTDTYACNLSPAITAYVMGTRYRFKAATANTGVASVNFNAVGVLTIKKRTGGITTDLADNEIGAAQWVECVYDGTNCQMVSQTGSASGGHTQNTDTGTTSTCFQLATSATGAKLCSDGAGGYTVKTSTDVVIMTAAADGTLTANGGFVGGASLKAGGACVDPSTVALPAAGSVTVFCNSSNSNHVSSKVSSGAVIDLEAGGGAATNGSASQALTSDGSGGFGTPVTLGDAAVKNTGTGAGTLAAGNDSRITGAAQLVADNNFTGANSFLRVTVKRLAAGAIAAHSLVRGVAGGKVGPLVSDTEGVLGVAENAAAADGDTVYVTLEGPTSIITEGSITDLHYLVAGTSDPTKAKDSGQTAKGAISTSVRIIAKAMGADSSGLVNANIIGSYQTGAQLTLSDIPVGVELTANRSGNGTKYCTVAGLLTAGNVITSDAAGNCIDSGVAMSTLLASGATPVITNGSLTQATEGTAYSQTLTASGGTSPYTFAVASGTLPTGLSLNTSTGAITGTPSSGSATITFRVTDNVSATSTKSLAVSVAAAAPTLDHGTATYSNDVSVTFTQATATAIHTCISTVDCTPSSSTTNPVTVGTTGNHACANADKTGYVTSARTCATYTLTAADPTSAVSGGSSGSLPSTVSACSGCLTFASGTTSAVIHYVTTGTATCSDTAYSGALSPTSTTTYSAIACKTGYNSSAAVSGTLTVSSPPQFVTAATGTASGASAATASYSITIGNLVYVVASANANAGSCVGSSPYFAVSDNGTAGGNTYVEIGHSSQAYTCVAVYYVVATKTATSVSVNYNGASTQKAFNVEQYTQVTTLDTTSSGAHAECTAAQDCSVTGFSTNASFPTQLVLMGCGTYYISDWSAGAMGGSTGTIGSGANRVGDANGAMSLAGEYRAITSQISSATLTMTATKASSPYQTGCIAASFY